MDVDLYQIDKNFYLCEFNYKNNKYSGIMDQKYRILVPFSISRIEEYVFTMDQNNYCFYRHSKKNKNHEAFHLSKNEEDNLFYIKKQFLGKEIDSLRVIDTEPPKNNYWFIETTIDGIVEISLYDIKKAEIITPPFSVISFEKEKGRVLAYVEKCIYAKIDDEQVMLASLSAFIDKDGKFLSQLYNPDTDDCFDTLAYNFDKTFKSFNTTIDCMRADLKDKFLSKKQYVEDTLDAMYNNIYTEEEINASKCSAKIIKFPNEVKNNDKK